MRSTSKMQKDFLDFITKQTPETAKAILRYQDKISAQVVYGAELAAAKQLLNQ